MPGCAGHHPVSSGRRIPIHLTLHALVDDLDDLLAIVDDQDPGVFPESAL